MIFQALARLFLHVFKFSRVGFILKILKVAFLNLTAFLHSSLNHVLLYFVEVELLGIYSSAMFNSVFVKYKMFFPLFLLASGVSWARHEVLTPSQLAFPRLLLGVLLLNSSVVFSNRIGKLSLPQVSSYTFQL